MRLDATSSVSNVIVNVWVTIIWARTQDRKVCGLHSSVFKVSIPWYVVCRTPVNLLWRGPKRLYCGSTSGSWRTFQTESLYTTTFPDPQSQYTQPYCVYYAKGLGMRLNCTKPANSVPCNPVKGSSNLRILHLTLYIAITIWTNLPVEPHIKDMLLQVDTCSSSLPYYYSIDLWIKEGIQDSDATGLTRFLPFSGFRGGPGLLCRLYTPLKPGSSQLIPGETKRGDEQWVTHNLSNQNQAW